MPEQSWKPLFRSPHSSITKVLQSSAFIASREKSGAIIGDPVALRSLAAAVEALDHGTPPLSAIADRVDAAVRFLRSRAKLLEAAPPAAAASVAHGSETHSAAGAAARERLIVAALHYLVTPVDLVPDFRAGGYLDDVVLLSWIFGAGAQELEPFLDPDA